MNCLYLYNSCVDIKLALIIYTTQQSWKTKVIINCFEREQKCPFFVTDTQQVYPPLLYKRYKFSLFFSQQRGRKQLVHS